MASCPADIRGSGAVRERRRLEGNALAVPLQKELISGLGSKTAHADEIARTIWFAVDAVAHLPGARHRAITGRASAAITGWYAAPEVCLGGEARGIGLGIATTRAAAHRVRGQAPDEGRELGATAGFLRLVVGVEGIVHAVVWQATRLREFLTDGGDLIGNVATARTTVSANSSSRSAAHPATKGSASTRARAPRRNSTAARLGAGPAATALVRAVRLSTTGNEQCCADPETDYPIDELHAPVMPCTPNHRNAGPISGRG